MHRLHRVSFLVTAAILVAAPWTPADEHVEPTYFEIRVVDATTNRGVPLVELVTVDNVRRVTDSAGRVAYFEPGQVGETVYFEIHAPGYEVPKDGFGFPGVRISIEAGGSHTITLDRVLPAERLYRATGIGIYRDSVLLGYDPPIAEPLHAGKVAGQDSVQAAVYRGKIHWFWGDTNRLSYPLGLFRTSGATSLPTSEGGLDPSSGVNYSYFVGDDGFSRAMVDVANPKGVVWIDGVAVVPDTSGNDRLIAHYSRRMSLADEVEHGILVYNDERYIFEVEATRPLDDHWRFVSVHPVRWTEDGTEYLLFGNPFPVTRVPATLAKVLDADSYESWSCLSEEDDPKRAKPLRDAEGKLDWKWRSGPPVTQEVESRWVKSGRIRPEEARFLPVDADQSGERVVMHSGAVHWNAHRRRWIMIAIELGVREASPSWLGEVWYSEAESPKGPWKTAIKVATHPKQSFYNPCHHPFFDQEGGRVIYFEGTYTNSFTDSPPTQRYNYNQIMYRLDLDHPKLRAAFR